jgi:hypothetical protein
MQQEFVHLELLIPCDKGSSCKLASHKCLECALEIMRGAFVDMESEIESNTGDESLPHVDIARVGDLFRDVIVGESNWRIIKNRVVVIKEE